MTATLEGLAFPGRPFRLCSEKVDEFLVSTGDDRDRWRHFAPPGMAASLLFVVAPELLSHPAVRGAVVHGEQTFTWHRPLPREEELLVDGEVERVRRRGEVDFVTFRLAAAASDGTLMVEGRSLFLIGSTRAVAEPELPPPPVDARAETVPPSLELPAPRSASRADLVRYAAATRDWNPIHWDHRSGVDATFGGVVIHGLLQAAWLTQVAALLGPMPRPLESARFRFTAPLRPAAPARIEGRLDPAAPELELVSDGTTTVSGRFVVAA